MRYFCFLIIFIVSSVYAQDEQQIKQQVQEAEALAENKQYPKATEAYQNMLQEFLKPWQRAVIMYNLGTTQMEQGDWSQAETTYHAVPLNHELAPLLKYRIAHNLAVIDFRQGVELIKKNPSQAVELLKKALSDIDSAEKAYCELSDVKGEQECRIGDELKQLRTATEQQLKLAQEQEKQKKTQPEEKKEEKEKPQPPSMPKETAPKKAEPASDKVLQMLIEMEQKDAKGPQAPSTLKKEMRPW